MAYEAVHMSDPALPGGGGWNQAHKVFDKKTGRWKWPGDPDDPEACHKRNLDGILVATTNFGVQVAFNVEGAPLEGNSIAPLTWLVVGPLLAGFSVSRFTDAWNDKKIIPAFAGVVGAGGSFMYAFLDMAETANTSPAGAVLVAVMGILGWSTGNELRKRV